MIKIKLHEMSGLTMKNGRLINEMPDGVTGIQRAADMRKMRKREDKIAVMDEAMYRAEMRADMKEMMRGKMGGSCDM